MSIESGPSVNSSSAESSRSKKNGGGNRKGGRGESHRGGGRNTHAEENGKRRSNKRKGQENSGEAQEGRGKKKEKNASDFPRLQKLVIPEDHSEKSTAGREYFSFLIEMQEPVQTELDQLEVDPHPDEKRLEYLRTAIKKIELAKKCLKGLDEIKKVEEAIFLQESAYDSAKDEYDWIGHVSSDIGAYVPACESAATKAEAKLAKAKKDAGRSPTEEQAKQIAELEVEKNEAVALANKAGKVFREGPQMKREAERKGSACLKEHGDLMRKRNTLLNNFDAMLKEEKSQFVSVEDMPGAAAAAAATGFAMVPYSEHASGGGSEGGGGSGDDRGSESSSMSEDSKESSKENADAEMKKEKGSDDEWEWDISPGKGLRRAGKIGWDTTKMFAGTVKRAGSEIIGFAVGLGGALFGSLLSYTKNPNKTFGGWKHWGDNDKKK